MATRYIGILAANIQAGQILNRANVVGASSGGTLAGSQSVQVVFDDAIFGSAAEGKQRLIAALETIISDLELSRTWPVDSTT